MLIGIVKPIPSFPPELLAMAVFMPITSPRRLISGPPLLPGIDRGVGLQKVLILDVGAQLQVAPAFGADDAKRHRMAQAEGAADGQHEVADFDVVAIAQPRRHQVRRRDRHDGDVGFRIFPNS